MPARRGEKPTPDKIVEQVLGLPLSGVAARLPLDGVFGPDRATEFVSRSFAPTRFGKAILQY